MNFIKSNFYAIIFTVLIGCKNDKDNNIIKQPINEAISTFYFIRHAEKDSSNPNNPDPELKQEGLGRSIFWAKIFEPIPLDKIYSTDYKRTKMTAAPIAVQKEVIVSYYDSKNIDIQQFLTNNIGKTILVVGHRNTIPDFVNKIIGKEKYSQMEDDDNGSLFTITIVGNQATATRLNIDISID